jgi:hypothetical protein
MDWTLIEPCCGTASLSLHLLGAKQALLPYQGSKWRYRKPLEQLVRELGFVGAPSTAVLTDAGPLGLVMDTLGDRRVLKKVILELEALEQEDPLKIFTWLNGSSPPRDKALFSARFLFLQRLSFSGKAVGVIGHRWVSPGFNKTSAYGLASTNKFGKINPMIPSLLRVLRGYLEDLPYGVIFSNQGQAFRPPHEKIAGRTLVYLDPPYKDSTDYPNGAMLREEVVELAQAWASAGASVVVSEGEPISELTNKSWAYQRISAGRNDTSKFRGKQEEWVTYAA